MDPVIHLESVRRSFGDVRAVDGLSFDVGRGEMFGLIGPDGAGKTTTLRMILGLLPRESGRVLTCGLDPAKERRRLSEKVGYLPQRFSLYGDLSIDENIAFFADVHGVANWRDRRDELLRLLRLADFRGRLADRLSGGMKQKLALACTLIHTPELLVLDEPTTGVDPVSRREFWKILSGLARDGITILLTTPYLDEAERCGRVALMDRGRILDLDTPRNLRKLGTGTVFEVLASSKRQAADVLKTHPAVTDIENFGERLHVSAPSVRPEEAAPVAAEFARKLQEAGLRVDSIRAGSPSLEDLFISKIRVAETHATEVQR